ncbi:MAG: hypothetical protein F2795_10650 [Actinobacteria bacterium]|uniref:Unannotated protein n=1 Tax=freshwater metagenome TaxID=449393 RepID=A0A6J7EZT5_9ZZZZ|nr:hypothetical protein [Actinomycetota bacterium]
MSVDPWAQLTQRAVRQHGVFLRKQASALGIDSRRLKTALRDNRIVAFSEQILGLAGFPSSVRRDARAATWLSSGAVASHRTAAALFGFEGNPFNHTDISVPLEQRLRVPVTMKVIVHHTSQLDKKDLVTVAGIPCTSKAHTLADLGSVVSPDVVLQVLIGARRDGLSLRTIRSVAQRLHRPGQQGTKVLLGHLDAFARAGAVPESWFEEVVRRIIDYPDLPRLIPQYELRHEGRVVARFDHAFPDARVAVESHSKRFHFGPVRAAVDEDRDLRVQRLGWVVVYLGWHATRRPSEVVEILRDVVAGRRWT